MIIKVIHSGLGVARFRKLQQYLEGEDRVDPLYVAGLDSETPLAFQMAQTASTAPRVEHPCYHLAISIPRYDVEIMQERRNDDWLAFPMDAIRETLRSLGAEEYQCAAWVHDHPTHWHIHLMLNRVHPTTMRALNVSHDYRRLRNVAKELERRFELSITSDYGQGSRDFYDARRVALQGEDLANFSRAKLWHNAIHREFWIEYWEWEKMRREEMRAELAAQANTWEGMRPYEDPALRLLGDVVCNIALLRKAVTHRAELQAALKQARLEAKSYPAPRIEDFLTSPNAVREVKRPEEIKRPKLTNFDGMNR